MLFITITCNKVAIKIIMRKHAIKSSIEYLEKEMRAGVIKEVTLTNLGLSCISNDDRLLGGGAEREDHGRLE